MKWTEVKYKCACMTQEKSIHVPARGKRENALEFMERARDLIAADHAESSPLCVSETMEYAKIPAPGGRVGEAEGGEA